MLRKANWDKTLSKSLKFSYCRKSIRKQMRPSWRKNLSTSFCVCLVSWKQRNLEIRANIPESCRRPVLSLLYATKSVLATLAFTAPNLCWACALASPVTFLTGDYVMQIGFGQISPSASSTRDLGTRLRSRMLNRHFCIKTAWRLGMSARQHRTLWEPTDNPKAKSIYAPSL